MIRLAVHLLFVVTLVSACAAPASTSSAGSRPAIQSGSSTKADVLDAYGPPAQRQAVEGDEFWYYVSRSVDPMAQMGHALQSFSAGAQGRAVPSPPPVETRTVIFRFDGRTGVLKSVHER